MYNKYATMFLLIQMFATRFRGFVCWDSNSATF